ncbi:DUF1731 domain-containing protein, partial [Streptomyces sp. NPDC040750]|uniref:DUF1731 domain-containing protein n=1 Tax=Streptomyces sp. NPDC040750 TaxID=3154491 RepID=UPI0033E3187E
PATKWMTEVGAFALRSDTELLLKSRRVVPGRLSQAGFDFQYAQWPQAADELVRRVRKRVGRVSELAGRVAAAKSPAS